MNLPRADNYCVAGYYMNFDSVHTLMSNLGIHDRGVKDVELEYPVNNWLAEQGKKNILAGAVPHPIQSTSNKEDGMVLMTQFVKSDYLLILEEGEEDEKVKQWLVDECGLKADELESHYFFDNYYLTCSGTEPRLNNRGPRERLDPIVPTEDYAREWEATGRKMSFFDFCVTRRNREEKKD